MVPQLAQALVQKFINQPTYMQGVTDAVTMIRRKVKLPRNSKYKSKVSKNAVAHLAVDDLLRCQTVGSTKFWANGHFSVCFRHVNVYGQEYAIKISLRQDDGAVPYYRWVYDNKLWLSNEHFPEVFFVGVVAGFDVCVMDWLPYGWDFDNAEYYAVVGESSPEHLHSLWLAGVKLKEFAEEAGYGFDIHSENIRTREDGTLVICDPLSFKKKEH